MWPYKGLGKLPRQLLLREMCRKAAYKQAQRATCPGGPRRGAVADADLAGLLQEPGRSHRNSLSLTWNVIVGYSQINKWAFLPSLLLLCNITVFWVCVRVCATSAKCKYSYEKWKIWIHICVCCFFLYVKDALTSSLKIKNNSKLLVTDTPMLYLKEIVWGHVNFWCFCPQTTHGDVWLRHYSPWSRRMEASGKIIVF